MAHGSKLQAHGSRLMDDGSWLMAKEGARGLGWQDPMDPYMEDPGLAHLLGHEPGAMRHEELSINIRIIIEAIVVDSLLNFSKHPPLGFRGALLGFV